MQLINSCLNYITTSSIAASIRWNLYYRGLHFECTKLDWNYKELSVIKLYCIIMRCLIKTGFVVLNIYLNLQLLFASCHKGQTHSEEPIPECIQTALSPSNLEHGQWWDHIFPLHKEQWLYSIETNIIRGSSHYLLSGYKLGYLFKMVSKIWLVNLYYKFKKLNKKYV